MMVYSTRLLSILSVVLVVLSAGLPVCAGELASCGRDTIFSNIVSPFLSAFPSPFTLTDSTWPGVGDKSQPSLIHSAPFIFLEPKPDSTPVTGHSPLATRLSKIAGRLISVRQSVLYTACESRPPIIRSPVTLYVLKSLYKARATYCLSYYHAKYPRLPISPPLPSPPSRPPSPPPPADQTEGICYPPTKTYITSASRPAEPTPAHAWTKRGAYAYEHESEETLATPSPISASPIDEDMTLSPDLTCRPSHYRSLMARIRHSTASFAFWLSAQQEFQGLQQLCGDLDRWEHRTAAWLGISWATFDIILKFPFMFAFVSLCMKVVSRVSGCGHLFDGNTGPTLRRVVHLSYELKVRAPRLRKKALKHEAKWVVSGEYRELRKLEQQGWEDTAAMLRVLEKECGGKPISGVEIVLTRTRKVFEMLEPSGPEMIPVEVRELSAGPKKYSSLASFRVDPRSEAHIEELGDVSLDEAGTSRRSRR